MTPVPPPATEPEPIPGEDPELQADFEQVEAPPASAHRDVFRRVGRNVAWLIGGRGFQGAASLGYLALAARGLGPVEFGVFTLILAYGQSIASLILFQTWQGVIRYGALHMADARPDRLARLLGFTTTLDVLGGIVGALLAFAGVGLAGHLLGWTPGEQTRASAFGAVLLLSAGGTPQGILRLFDRFDLLTWCEAVGPLLRLVGSIAVWWTGRGLDAFLVVWAVAAVAQSLVTWIVAVHAAKVRFAFGRKAVADAVSDNRRLWRFMIQTNASSSLGLVGQQLGTLAVGAVAGPAAAGGFRIAGRLAKAIAKPMQSLTRVLYPEFARLIASGDRVTLANVMRRTTFVAMALAAVVILVSVFGGHWILGAFAGKEYGFARIYLVVLAVAAAVDVAGFALEPLHTAHGKAGRVLGARAIGAAAYGVVLAVALPTLGPVGAAIAGVVNSVVVRMRLAASARRLLADQPAG